ncbi:YlzJ-like family protein [Paludicola sp. MB14-C6]|uniref:YlzJ-like family protein n=1 Tax=Paludihabitans sp. MB14-C6 TaxID=3070656 RepID=UPI0027DD21EA|nr:YlzJ-like family protein [Paludicola sp. MB14-C6]WMJ23284.1 YlzJ-like family protein [Paludicola sp. MB14-C6]
MILHTIIDPMDVMNSPSANNFCYKKCVNGAIIEGTQDMNGIKINRIISTNPSDYLNKDYTLGNYLK